MDLTVFNNNFDPHQKGKHILDNLEKNKKTSLISNE
jgi:hypothetical protein